MPALVLDIVIVLLLAATIGFAWSLNKRLAVLRDDSGKLEQLVAGLQTASIRAETAVASLKSSVESAGRQLQERIDAAEGLKADLQFVTERGNTTADRLELGRMELSHLENAGPTGRDNPAGRDGIPKKSEQIVAKHALGSRPTAPTAAVDNADKAGQSRLANLLKQAANPSGTPAPLRDAALREPARREASLPDPGSNDGTDFGDEDATGDEAPTQSRSERDLLNALQGRK